MRCIGCTKLNQHGSAMIAVLAMALILNVTLLAFFFTTQHNNKASGVRKLDVTALNIAEGGKEHFYADLVNNICIPLKDTSIDYFLRQPFKSGYYSVNYTSKRWGDSLWIVGEGAENGAKSVIDVIAIVNPYLSINNPPITGAVTAHSKVEVTGNIEVDGNDHDTLCNKVGNGVYGVSSCDSFYLSGSASIGGNGHDLEGKHKFETYRSILVEEDVPTSSKFNSPESFLGIPEHSLDSYRSSDPDIPQDFRALIYKTVDVQSLHFGDNAAGVLIVHNDAKNAQLSVNSGTFKGLIIVDDFTKISGNVEIHGAIVALKDSMVVVDGVGTGMICYSSEVLKHLSSYCNNFRKSVDEVSWEERPRH